MVMKGETASGNVTGDLSGGSYRLDTPGVRRSKRVAAIERIERYGWAPGLMALETQDLLRLLDRRDDIGSRVKAISARWAMAIIYPKTEDQIRALVVAWDIVSRRLGEDSTETKELKQTLAISGVVGKYAWIEVFVLCARRLKRVMHVSIPALNEAAKSRVLSTLLTSKPH